MEPIQPEDDVLQTIDGEALACLTEDILKEDYIPSTPEEPAMRGEHGSAQSVTDLTDVAAAVGLGVGDEVIRSCVTPRKISGVKDVLKRKSHRHKCALKLLPFFFSKEELSNSNTEGTHNKLPLDSTRLNSLKVLVFTRFPIESPIEREKVWKSIKSKINSKCHVSQHINKQASHRAP